MKKNLWGVAFIVLTTLTSCQQKAKKEEKSTPETANVQALENPVFIGTYTKKEDHVDGKAQGIYLMDRSNDGTLTMIKTAAEATNPSWITLSHDKKYLYAVNELVENEAKSGVVNVYKVEDDLSLTFIDKASTGAYAPCHIAVDATDNYVFIANYVGGVFMEFKREENGTLTEIAKVDLNKLPDAVTKNSHAHEITFSKNNKYVYINDLGDDKIWIYDFNQENGKIKPNDQPFVSTVKGAGPRHLVIDQQQKFAYSINELNSTITTFAYEESTGHLKKVAAISTLPDDFEGANSTAEIAIHPKGNYLYASNRGHNSIAAYKINSEDGTLSLIGFQPTEGKFPRYFGITNNGNTIYAANQNSGTIAELNIHRDGSLSFAKKITKVPTPVCMVFFND